MLVIDISTNRENHIVSIGAIRINPTKCNVADDVLCTYEVGRIYEGKIPRPVGEIEHIHGEGAEVLAAKAISKVTDSGGSTLEEDNLQRLLLLMYEREKD